MSVRYFSASLKSDSTSERAFSQGFKKTSSSLLFFCFKSLFFKLISTAIFKASCLLSIVCWERFFKNKFLRFCFTPKNSFDPKISDLTASKSLRRKSSSEIPVLFNGFSSNLYFCNRACLSASPLESWMDSIFSWRLCPGSATCWR